MVMNNMTLPPFGYGSLFGRPSAMGRVFFVHAFTGNDNNKGDDPNAPFATLRHALDQCVNDRNDYIFVLDCWQEAMPIAIDVTTVHIIGVGGQPNRPYPLWNAAGDTAIFEISSASNNCEIAGFGFGGGATHAAIENSGGTPMGVWIHDCIFGHSFCNNTPQDGIRIEVNATAIRIERCCFYGSGGLTSPGTITRDGIRFQGGGDPLGGVIANNLFLGCPGVAINFVTVAADSGGIAIVVNNIACDANTQGAAISLGASCGGFIISDNRANFGDTDMGQNPFLDGAAAGNNHWMANWLGITPTQPA